MNLSYEEVLAWQEYRRLHGPLTLAKHIANASATVSLTVSGTVSRRRGSQAPKFEDFLPQWGERSANDSVLTLEEAMNIL